MNGLKDITKMSYQDLLLYHSQMQKAYEEALNIGLLQKASFFYKRANNCKTLLKDHTVRASK